MQSIKSFGIVGCGEFGQVAAKHLAPAGTEVRVFDIDATRELPTHATRASLATVATSDVVVLSGPFNAYRELVPEVMAKAHEDSLIVDVCSVKVEPTRLFAGHGLLDRENVLMTHPLFGPQTTNGDIAGKTIVTTQADGPLTKELLKAWDDKGVNLIDMSAEDHDKEMAKVHALPFMIGRSLLKMDVTESALTTNYFGKLLALIEVERHHSPELFRTIQEHNPYAANMRSEFIATMSALHAEILVDGYNPKTDPLEALESHRATLDVIDRYRMELLGLRFAVTQQIGNIKAQAELPSVDPSREAAQRTALTDQARQANVPEALALEIQQLVVGEVVGQHEAIKATARPTEANG